MKLFNVDKYDEDVWTIMTLYLFRLLYGYLGIRISCFSEQISNFSFALFTPRVDVDFGSNLEPTSHG